MKYWIQAFRLRTLWLSLASIGMGAFLTQSNGMPKIDILSLCLLTTIALQILSNLVNDYGDAIHGADNVHRKGPKRTVQTGLVTKKDMRKAIFLFRTS